MANDLRTGQVPGTDRPESASSRGVVRTLADVAGLVAYAASGVLYLGAGLVVPYPWVYGFWVAWVGGAAAAGFVFSRRRGWTVAVSVAAVGFWVIAVSVGSSLFGWTA